MRRFFIALIVAILIISAIICTMNIKSYAKTSYDENLIYISDKYILNDNLISNLSNEEFNGDLLKDDLKNIVNKLYKKINKISNKDSQEDGVTVKSFSLKRNNVNEYEYYDIITNKYRFYINANDYSIIGIYHNGYTETQTEEISDEMAENVAKQIYKELDFPEEYELCFVDTRNTKICEADFQANEDGILNPFESVKMFFDPITCELVALTRFNQKPSSNDNELDIDVIRRNKEQYENAINIILNSEMNVNTNNHRLDFNTAIVTYTQANTFFVKGNKATGVEPSIRKVWKIECENNLTVYIDCASGKIVKGDFYRYEEAQAQNANYFIQYDGDCTNAAAFGFNSLGYNTSTATATNSNISNWIDDSQGAHYAYFIVTHGDTYNDGTIFFVSSTGTYFDASDVSGNWHLVFIDACHSKDNESLASGFNITYSHSNRAYLGWEGPVGAYYDWLFAPYFWHTYVTHTTIQQAAINAAAMVPGSGTTPIRFTGDTSWWGYAN